MYLIFIYLLPFCLLAVFNTIIFIKIRKLFFFNYSQNNIFWGKPMGILAVTKAKNIRIFFFKSRIFLNKNVFKIRNFILLPRATPITSASISNNFFVDHMIGLIRFILEPVLGKPHDWVNPVYFRASLRKTTWLG